VFLNGRTEYMDKYAEVVDELNQRGLEVYCCDWRGQGLSERMLADSQKGHVERFEDYLKDLDQLMTIVENQGAPSPLTLLGHSMGGHIAVRYIERCPTVFSRVVLTSPMIDIQVPKYLPRQFLVWLVKTAVRSGLQGAYVFGSGGFNARDREFEGNPLTSDRWRFERNLSMIAKDPRLAVGGVTYGWLAAALRSIRYVTSASFASNLRLPLLLVSAEEDKIVCPRAQDRFCRQVPDCRMVRVEGARHELLVETDHRRAIFWQAFDRFLAT
jgi:lysophospholipase